MLWFFLAAIALLLGLWPFGFYQVTLLAAARMGRFAKTPVGVHEPQANKFAICICAYNEAGCIESKITNLLAMREANGGDLDILVYVDGASDGTVDILERFEDRIRLFVSDRRRGKTHGMNFLVQQTDATIVLFSDANVMVDPNAIEVLNRYFADPNIGCVCSNLVYVNATEGSTAQVGSTFWNFNEWTKGLETQTGSVIGADGALFAIRRKLHRPVPYGLIDDITISFYVLFQGYRVIRAPDLLAFESHTTRSGDEFRRKVRIACECLHVHFHTWPQWRQQSLWNLYKYLAHRVLRWLAGFNLALAAIFAVLGIAGIVGIGPTLGLIATIGGIWALSLLQGRPYAKKLFDIVLAFGGVSLGIWRALLGERAITWDIAGSSREIPIAVSNRQG